MIKEKFHIPMPDEQTIQIQIHQIVDAALKPRISFPSYLKLMYQQIGIKHLFSDRSEYVYALITVVTFLSIFFFKPEMAHTMVDYLYGFLFMVSPVLYIILSIYTFTNKMMNSTFEVEMTCKYNVYQIIAFRMLVYSVIAILFNTINIFLMSLIYEDVQFVRAFMISNTGLFIFSVLFLFAMMKRRSTAVAAITIIGWTLGNLLLIYMGDPLYRNVLTNMPLFIYALVLVVTLYMYLKSLHRLIHHQQVGGAF